MAGLSWRFVTVTMRPYSGEGRWRRDSARLGGAKPIMGKQTILLRSDSANGASEKPRNSPRFHHSFRELAWMKFAAPPVTNTISVHYWTFITILEVKLTNVKRKKKNIFLFIIEVLVFTRVQRCFYYFVPLIYLNGVDLSSQQIHIPKNSLLSTQDLSFCHFTF